MLVDTVSELEVLIKHGSQRKRYRLYGLLVVACGFLEIIPTLSIIYDVGGASFGSLKYEVTDGISRSSKKIPPTIC